MMSTTIEPRLAGRRIVLFGGASGIGRETAILFAQNGAKVCVVDRPTPALAEIAELISGFSRSADITSQTEVDDAIHAAADDMGGIDGLVITAGIFDPSTLENTTADIWSRVIAVNLTGTFHACKSALPHLRAGGNATIVTLGSGVALIPNGPTSAAYVAAKGGVIALSRQMAKEAGPAVRVNCVCPGMIETPMTESFLKTDSGEIKSSISGQYTLKRTGTPEEIASAILFLTSSESSFITGTTLAVDGGRVFH